MNDESDESVHLSLCVYVKDEPVYGNTLWTMNDESVHGNTRVKDDSVHLSPCVYALRILILFEGGRCWSKEYQKNSRKFKICIIMHKICILCIFLKMPKNHFPGISDASKQFWFFYLKKFLDLSRTISEFMHILCFPENKLIALILLWDSCYWFTEYGRWWGRAWGCREGVVRTLEGCWEGVGRDLAGGEGWGWGSDL